MNFFTATVAGENVDAVEDSGIEEAESIDLALFDARNSVEDIEFVWNQGLEFDNDNDPAPKYIPLLDETPNHNQLNDWQLWGFDFVNQRAITRVVDQAPKFHGGWIPKNNSILNNFMKILPRDFFSTQSFKKLPMRL